MFSGTYTALVTPFRNGSIDIPAFQALVERQINAGVAGIIAVGTTGESPTLTRDERDQVIRLAIEIAAGRCKVLAGTGSYSTAQTIDATIEAEKMRADGALIVAPYYNKPSQEGLFRHFSAVARTVKIPIMLYNIPGRCGVDISVDTVARLAAECRNICSIKEASGSVDRVSELRRCLPESFTILSGDDSLTLPFLAAGAVGVVSVASNLLPAEVAALVDAFRRGDIAGAQQLHRRLGPIFKNLFIEPNPVPVKTALAWRGTMSSEVRLPLCEMSADNEARLRETIQAFEKSE